MSKLILKSRHRLMCGDSTKSEDVAKLLCGQKADMLLTDPPYNIGSDSKNFVAGGGNSLRGDISKAMSQLAAADWDKNFDIKTPLALATVNLKDDAVAYVWTSHFLIQKIWDHFNSERFSHVSYVVWTKPNPMPCLSKRHWTWATELCVYATKGRHVCNFPKEGHALNWFDVRKNSDGTHITQKTIEVIAHTMAMSSNEGSLVLDLFLGSGTTLIAAEQLHRRCFGMELSPSYADVSVARWQKFTGKTAVLEATGEPFPVAEVAVG
jgi:DNA modification methylase